MDAATVSRVMDLIPERVTRTQSGVAFGDVRATTCVHPERLALLTEFLHWLSPIYPTTKDDQMRFGLFAGKNTPVEEEEDETIELEEETVV
jgi:hypothetical protein